MSCCNPCGGVGGGAPADGGASSEPADAGVQVTPPDSATSSASCTPATERAAQLGRLVMEGDFGAAFDLFGRDPGGAGVKCWPLWIWALLAIVAWGLYRSNGGSG